jgi:hypothetical protein
LLNCGTGSHEEGAPLFVAAGRGALPRGVKSGALAQFPPGAAPLGLLDQMS